MLRLSLALTLALSGTCVFAQDRSGTVVQGSAGWGHTSTTGKTEGRSLWAIGNEPWNPNQKSSMAGKKFDKTTNPNIRNANLGTTSYSVDGRSPTGEFKQTREFFGLKNPWFGKKVYTTDQAALGSKSFVANSEKKFPVDAAATRDFYQADKKAAEKTTSFVTRDGTMAPKAQGSLDTVAKQGNLTIEQVRELLNKPH